ncbi:MAG: aminopeptidase P family protein [Chloroflexi bacterium]|nr:aminopeptidase P family protein [Chloroflexota bacterium]
MAAQTKQMHERDVLGRQVVDFEARVDVKRLRRERIQRIQAELVKADLGAILLWDPVNMRYATGTRLMEPFMVRFKNRSVLVPREGRPILFQPSRVEGPVVGDDVELRDMLTFEFWQCGTHTPEATLIWAGRMKGVLKELGIAGERIGIDRMDPDSIFALADQGVKICGAMAPIGWARAIKTVDEIALIRQACAIADVAISKVRDAIKPGVTENKLFSIMSAVNLEYGGERIDGKLLAAGGNTNPWLHREASERVVRPGDLVALDTDMAGPLGYFADISRTFLCGDVKPNEEQTDAYKRAYEFLQIGIPKFRPGAAFQEIAESMPQVPDEYKANRYVVLAHGVGMSDEWPALYFPDTSDTGFGNDVGEIKENMVICMEASFGREDGREQVKLEEQLLITKDGPELLSQAPYDWRFLT